jgi:tryptophan-rich sensory protein
MWVGQLLLNGAWSPIFFGLHSLGGGLITIALLWLAILATAIAFRPLSRPAAILMLPYLVWVTFAACLNLALWRLNP